MNEETVIIDHRWKDLKTGFLLKSSVLAVMFVGELGKETLSKFRAAKKSSPILNQCEHIISPKKFCISTIDVNATSELLSRIDDTEYQIIIADLSNPENLPFVESIAANLKPAHAKNVICLTSHSNIEITMSNYKLVCVTKTGHQDLTSDILLTFYNTILGCGRLGNMMCMKLNLDDLERMGLEDRIAYCSMAFKQKGEAGYNVQDIMKECQLASRQSKPKLAWYILEGPQKESVSFYVNFMEQLPIPEENWLLLCHAGFIREEIKLTSIVIP